MRTMQEFSDSPDLMPTAVWAFRQVSRLPLPYIGTKKKLIKAIHESLIKHDLSFNSVLDAFSGSAVVSLMFRLMGKQVISNDILTSSYMNSLSFVENDKISLSLDEQEYLLNHINPHRKFFVETNYLNKKFTLKECRYLDNFRANVDDLDNIYSQSLAMIANASVVMRLPFGNVDQSADIMNHRIKQQQLYGENSKNHDRRIGIYYDQDMNLNFDKWFRKYVLDFNVKKQSIREIKKYSIDLLSSLKNHSNSLATNKSINCDVIEALTKYSTVDAVYFDPPYGGKSSDYANLYRFFEEYIYSDLLDNLPHIKNSFKFTSKASYEENFKQMLDASTPIKTWLFSYNDSSWQKVEYIVDLIKKYKNSVHVDMLSSTYRYLYRNKNERTRSCEYLIIAR